MQPLIPSTSTPPPTAPPPPLPQSVRRHVKRTAILLLSSNITTFFNTLREANISCKSRSLVGMSTAALHFTKDIDNALCIIDYIDEYFEILTPSQMAEVISALIKSPYPTDRRIISFLSRLELDEDRYDTLNDLLIDFQKVADRRPTALKYFLSHFYRAENLEQTLDRLCTVPFYEKENIERYHSMVLSINGHLIPPSNIEQMFALAVIHANVIRIRALFPFLSNPYNVAQENPHSLNVDNNRNVTETLEDLGVSQRSATIARHIYDYVLKAQLFISVATIGSLAYRQSTINTRFQVNWVDTIAETGTVMCILFFGIFYCGVVFGGRGEDSKHVINHYSNIIAGKIERLLPS